MYLKRIIFLSFCKLVFDNTTFIKCKIYLFKLLIHILHENISTNVNSETLLSLNSLPVQLICGNDCLSLNFWSLADSKEYNYVLKQSK
jgi:hypothetical protein